jgi:hypothetical protein
MMHSTTALHTASVAATCKYHQSDYKKSQAKHAMRSPIPKRLTFAAVEKILQTRSCYMYQH